MNNAELLMLWGLPASGKTTHAKGLKTHVRVNKDDIRNMFGSSVNEAAVIACQDAAIQALLKDGKSVVVDDTNLNPWHQKRLRNMAICCGSKFTMLKFDTPLEVCIERDSKREKPVGAEVIVGMYEKHVKISFEIVDISVPVRGDDLQNAIICDLDGTLAIIGDRSPYDGRACSVDTLCNEVALVLRWAAGHDTKILFVSGRGDDARLETDRWLVDHGFSSDCCLFMRKAGDTRKDSIVKSEIYRDYIYGKYNILFVMDDRNSVVDFWRSIGLKCFQVEPGDF